MNFPANYIYILGRGPDFYDRIFGPIPEGARVINVASGPSYWPRADLNIDPLYHKSAEAIWERACADTEFLHRDLIQKFPEEAAKGQELFQYRYLAHSAFRRDFLVNPAHYQWGQLPYVRHVKGDLAIVAHLLFAYDLGLEFHMAAIANLLEIAPEARIFPFGVNMVEVLASAQPQFRFDTNNQYLKVTHA